MANFNNDNRHTQDVELRRYIRLCRHGTGAGGSIVASRLSEDPGVTICSLEAGPPDTHPFIHLPAGLIKILFNPKYSWQFKTEPSEFVNGRSVSVPIGRTVGGSTSVNGMSINRGQAADFNNWANSGNIGWGYADVLPYFRKFERRIGAADDTYRGRDGKIPVTDIDRIDPACEAFIEGAVEYGIPRNDDYNGSDQAGVGYHNDRSSRVCAGAQHACSCCRRCARRSGSTCEPMLASAISFSRASARRRPLYRRARRLKDARCACAPRS